MSTEGQKHNQHLTGNILDSPSRIINKGSIKMPKNMTLKDAQGPALLKVRTKQKLDAEKQDLCTAANLQLQCKQQESKLDFKLSYFVSVIEKAIMTN